MQLSKKQNVFSKFCCISKICIKFFNIFTADDKYSLLNRDNLPQPIQIKLSNKQKSFYQFFTTFLCKCTSILNILNKKMSLIAYVFPKLQIAKETVNILYCLKHCWDLHDNTLIRFFHHFEKIELENVSLSDIWNFRTVC